MIQFLLQWRFTVVFAVMVAAVTVVAAIAQPPDGHAGPVTPPPVTATATATATATVTVQVPTPTSSSTFISPGPVTVPFAGPSATGPAPTPTASSSPPPPPPSSSVPTPQNPAGGNPNDMCLVVVDDDRIVQVPCHSL